MAMLRRGQRLRSGTGQPVLVKELIGEGGQGEVYRVDVEGRGYALKWYHHPATSQQREWAAEQRLALEDYLLRTSPPDKRFLWPQGIVDDPRGLTYGYLMDLLPDRYQGLELLVLGRMRPVPRFTALCGAAINLAECFRKLHNAGACYKDINLGGPVIDPRTGDILVCDCDNVRVNKTPGNVIFVFFAAPELILGNGTCQTNTDIHSLAVLLFYMFVRHHPLEGKKELQVNVFNEAAQRKFYGRQPVFIFDPDDDSNRPVPGFHDSASRNWPFYPDFIQKLFVRAFTAGLHDPARRVREGEWMDAFARLRDSIYYCPGCGVENFHLEEPQACWRCEVEGRLPPRLDLGRATVMLNHDTRLFPHHLGKRLDFGAPLAALDRHPKRPNVWGLKNLGRRKWRWMLPGGEEKDCMPGRAVPIRNGLEIDFGGVTGVVRA